MLIDWPRLLRALTGHPEPTDLPTLVAAGFIQGSEVYTILKEKFPDASIYISDVTFWTCHKAEVQKIIDFVGEQRQKYVVEDFDCLLP
jgi:hypothetical protein